MGTAREAPTAAATWFPRHLSTTTATSTTAVTTITTAATAAGAHPRPNRLRPSARAGSDMGGPGGSGPLRRAWPSTQHCRDGTRTHPAARSAQVAA